MSEQDNFAKSWQQGKATKKISVISLLLAFTNATDIVLVSHIVKF